MELPNLFILFLNGNKLIKEDEHHAFFHLSNVRERYLFNWYFSRAAANMKRA